jgi:hypothetical protein
MRVFEKPVQQSDSPFIGDDPVDYREWGVPAGEEHKESSAGFQNLRSVPNEGLRVWHVFDEIAGSDGIEGLRLEWEVFGKIGNYGRFDVGIF